MANKRKAPGSHSAKKPEEDYTKRVKLNVNSYQDVAGSDDEFHIGQDKVLLDEDEGVKRARRQREKEEFLEDDEEEVLAYSDEDDEQDDEVQGEDEAGAGYHTSDGEDAEEEEDELNEWGASRKDYYGADEMETEQDALDEEAEAKRLQKKQLESMNAADYGFDEDEWASKETDKVEKPKTKKTVTETLPRLVITDDMSATDRLKVLKSRHPEFEPLSKEFLDVQESLESLKSVSGDRSGKASAGAATAASALVIKERAATAYLAVLAMYFALLTTGVEEDGSAVVAGTNVRDHPIMESLIQTRQLWQRVKDLPEDEEEHVSSDEGSFMTAKELQSPAKALPAPRRRVRKSKAQKAADAAARASEVRRADRLAQAEAEIADLDDLLAGSKRSGTRNKTAVPRTTTDDDEDSDLGEEELSEKALADKAAKRKSLRFYTSQIAQKSNKRGAAGRSAGGDEDIPYRERFRDRQARLNAEAAKRGQRAGGADAELGGDSDDEDRAAAAAVRGEAADDVGGDEYYQYIAGKTAGKKEDKEELAAARKEALLNGGRVVEQETVGEDGKRKIGYMIEKNKGLTPHRKKDVRNPRVKKRKKYDERKKKLGSMKAVYKGGEGRGGGGMGGQQSGIKTNLVKSRKL